MLKVLDNKFQIYIPLTIFENGMVRELNKKELQYKNGFLDTITEEFGGVTLSESYGKYKRADCIVNTKNEIVTIYSNSSLKAFEFLHDKALELKKELNQESIAIVTVQNGTDTMILI